MCDELCEAGLTVYCAPSEPAPPDLGPASSGQVYKIGPYLYQKTATFFRRYYVNGVQYILPQRAINNSTFYEGNYQNSLDEIERWLAVASQQLLAETVRIFVEMPAPGATTEPTKPETIYDFAMRASKHNLRLGIVLHNISASYTIDPTRRAWINRLIQLFTQGNTKGRIAYISTSNEINNYCQGGGKDCYDFEPGGEVAYATKANNLVAGIADLFRNTGILTTVGIATEVDFNPQHNGNVVRDFFIADSQGRKLATLVDFISPHNYGGGAPGILFQIRHSSYGYMYRGPVVLEEYGFPTDPDDADATYTEGPNLALCRTQPLHADCVNTAPYFVEVNANALRTANFTSMYAGGAAFMLVDMNNKGCNQGRSGSDNYTGLYTSSNIYCGGTKTPFGGLEKSTGFRVKTHHYYYGKPTSGNLCDTVCVNRR